MACRRRTRHCFPHKFPTSLCPSPPRRSDLLRLEFPRLPNTFLHLLKTMIAKYLQAPTTSSTLADRKHDHYQISVVIVYLGSLHIIKTKSPEFPQKRYITSHAKAILTSVHEILQMCARSPRSRSIDLELEEPIVFAKKMYPLVKDDLPGALNIYEAFSMVPEPTVEDEGAANLLFGITLYYPMRRCMNPSCFPTTGESHSHSLCFAHSNSACRSGECINSLLWVRIILTLYVEFRRLPHSHSAMTR